MTVSTARKRASTTKGAPLGTKTIYRFTNRGPDRNAVVLVFELEKRTKLELLVKGPGPSCEVVARLTVTGRAGTNRVRFAGRPHGRVLAPGAYVLELRSRRTDAALGEVLVGIVAPGARKVNPEVLPRCETADRVRPSLVLASGPSVGPPLGGNRKSGSVAPRPKSPASGVLEEVSPEAGFPVPGAVDLADGDDVGLFELFFLTVALASLLALLVGGGYELFRRRRPLT